MAVVWQSDGPIEAGAHRSDQVTYIRRLGAAVRSAIEARQRLTDELARYERTGLAALPALGRVASAAGHDFDEARWVVSAHQAPRGAEVCSLALRQWLTFHVDACDALSRAAGTGEARHLRAALDLLRGAQPFALQFNRVRERLAGQLAA
ncbi:MAG TPA: hypothetical protein VGL23_01860 [Chloroflexota bacterium]|jgi:hypothetical protein